MALLAGSAQTTAHAQDWHANSPSCPAARLGNAGECINLAKRGPLLGATAFAEASQSFSTAMASLAMPSRRRVTTILQRTFL